MTETDYEFIKKRLAPCGLHCGKCFAFAEGDIRHFSQQLKQSLGNFDIYAARFTELLQEPVFRKYPSFKALLDHLTTVNCNGCRAEKCKLFSNCKVRSCSEEKNVEFCFQCPDFPCRHTGFDEHLYQRHIEINKRIKEIGVEAYYQEVKNLSRYT